MTPPAVQLMPTTQRRHHRGAILLLTFALLIGFLSASSPRAAAAGEPVFRASQELVAGVQAQDWFGLVLTEPATAPPNRIRALGANGVVCGTGDVVESGQDTGFFTMSVASGLMRAGCPQVGEAVQFVLLYGNIDSGSLGVSADPLVYGTQQVGIAILTVGERVAEASAWRSILGGVVTTPEPGRFAMTRWMGPDGVPVEPALAMLGFDVTAAWRQDTETGRWQAWTSGAPSIAQSLRVLERGDLVVVRRAAATSE